MRFLLDTNVLVYSVDQLDEVKRQRAQELIRALGSTDQAVLSAQVLAEFANVIVRRSESREALDEARKQVERFAQAFTALPLTPALVLEAVRGVQDYQLSYYDAQIWAGARLNQIPIVLSEDFNPGATIEGVTFLNPFAEDFRVEELDG